VLSDLLSVLHERWDDGSSPVAIHGDANANNAILRNGHVALIDLDRAARGPAASDIGNFLSLLAYSRALGRMRREEEAERAAAFLRGYSSARDLPGPDALDLHTSAALVERAVAAIYRLRPHALGYVPRLLGEARELLNGGPH
jgi:Ser/Thr protein kinase RdoA (MazF antagonist)